MSASTSPPPIVDWRRLLLVYWITSVIEGMGTSQIFALLPISLRMVGVPEDDRLAFVGLFTALIFIVGAPFVPLWGVWADKYSRKAVIVRSALVEAVVFAAAALAREPWQLAASLLLIGLQLGNTGVMLAGLREVAPQHRIGTILALFGASGPIGFAAGPALAGILIDGAGWTVPAVFALSAVLSVGAALLVTFGSPEIRPPVVPSGPVLRLAYGAVRGVLSDRVVRSIFAIFGVGMLANQMSRPYVPILVEDIVGIGPGLASSIALVTGTAALAGALVSPAIGALGDRAGFRPVLIACLAGGSVALALMPFAPEVALLAGIAFVFAAAWSGVGAMVFGLVATVVAPDRRSATLNLVYLPLYAAGVVGPATGSIVASATGVGGPFVAGAIVLAAGALAIALREPVAGSRRRRGPPGAGPAAASGGRAGPPPSSEVAGS